MKSIRGKILLCMVCTVTMVLVILGFTSIIFTYTSSNDLLEQTMSETAKVASERVTQELLAYTNVAIDTGLTTSISDPKETVDSKKETINQRAQAHGFKRGNIIGADGISIFDGKDYSDRLYYQKATTGIPYISEPLISKITGELSIMVAAPIWENGVINSKVVGVVYFVPPETFLNDVVSKIKVSENGSAYAINSNGTTIADVTLETITTKNVEELAKTDSSLNSLAEMHSKMRNGESGFGSYTDAGEQKLLAYAPIEGTDGWSIGLTAPQADFMDATNNAIIVTLILLIIAIIISILVAYKLANGIGNPIKRCAMRLQALAIGDLNAEVPQVNSKDETGALAEATASIVSTMRGILTDIDYGLSEMAMGNFEVISNAQELYVGDFSSLSGSMYKIIDKLNDTLKQIGTTAEQVSSGSDLVSSGAQTLSQGTTEQANSIEELAATIAEISVKVKQTAENADLARDKTQQSSKSVEICNQQMQEMINAIDEITHKSSEIGKIIKTIEDIAFQTNILALNAAVEAARAGLAGKGFAVVAEEVRNLATKSAEASKNTSTLIEGSIVAVRRGTSIASETAQSLQQVVKSSHATSDIVDKIAAHASEQAISVAQIMQGVDQISAVVQTNSATSEESAAASEELSSQAQILKQLVNRFNLKKN